MVFASYDPTAFEKTLAYVIIVAVIVIIIIFHVLLVRKILENEKTGKGKRIIGMVIVASIFWIIAYLPLVMGYVNMLNYGVALSSSMFFFPTMLFLCGAFLVCLGAGLGYFFAFSM